jgi:8-oxo-dGTP pyrophosphatase MutT (NUDIX family)
MRGLRRLVGTQRILVPAVAAILRDEAGRILLMRKAEDGTWSLPAGAIDPGETPREAVVRETAEETGLRVEPVRLVDVVGGADYRITYPGGDEVEFTVCVFEGRVIGGHLHAADGEAAALEWVEPERVPDLLLHPYPAWLFARPEATG